MVEGSTPNRDARLFVFTKYSCPKRYLRYSTFFAESSRPSVVSISFSMEHPYLIKFGRIPNFPGFRYNQEKQINKAQMLYGNRASYTRLALAVRWSWYYRHRTYRNGGAE